MKRRNVLSLLAAACVLAACATAEQPAAPPEPADAFSSDRISVVAQGVGPDVILIPGLSSHRDIWASTAATFDGDYRLHLVQVSGFAGVEPGANADGPVAAPVAEEIARYIEEEGLERPAVIGHSMGGTIAMMLAARHPADVGKLMVVDMFPFMGAMFGPPGSSAEDVRPTADQMRTQMLAAPPGMSEGIIRQTIAGMVRTEAARPAIVQHSLDSNRRTVANAFHELIVTDLRPELANISAPLTALYVIPPQMPLTEEQYEGYMHASYENAPDARLIRIDDSYHFIMVDQPELFLAHVRMFLESN